MVNRENGAKQIINKRVIIINFLKILAIQRKIIKQTK